MPPEKEAKARQNNRNFMFPMRKREREREIINNFITILYCFIVFNSLLLLCKINIVYVVLYLAKEEE